MELFDSDDYKFISNFVEQKIPKLRKNKNFEKIYVKLNDEMDEMEKILPKQQKEKFDEIVKLFYQTEEYYFALIYLLGAKYGMELNKL